MKKLVLALLGIVAIAIAWWLLSPLFLNKTVDEDLAFNTPIQDDTSNEPDVMVDEEPMQDAPTVVAQGTFQDADSAHKGSGSATVYEQDGQHVLRFEDFSVTNGPDLRVLLAKDVNNLDAGYVELEKLKGNMGNQNYTLAEDIDPAAYDGVVIYCKPFHVTFSTATF